jgi:hypothetical protein
MASARFSLMFISSANVLTPDRLSLISHTHWRVSWRMIRTVEQPISIEFLRGMCHHPVTNHCIKTGFPRLSRKSGSFCFRTGGASGAIIVVCMCGRVIDIAGQ